MEEKTVTNSTILEINPDYEYTIAAKKKTNHQRKHPMFHAVGYQTTYNNKSQGFPFLDILLDLTKPEQQLFRVILARLDSIENLAYVPLTLLDGWDAPRLSRIYKQLKERGLTKRTMPNYYMVNPDAIFHPKTYANTKKKWDRLT
jgi:hypothetical protein